MFNIVHVIISFSMLSALNYSERSRIYFDSMVTSYIFFSSFEMSKNLSFFESWKFCVNYPIVRQMLCATKDDKFHDITLREMTKHLYTISIPSDIWHFSSKVGLWITRNNIHGHEKRIHVGQMCVMHKYPKLFWQNF